MSGNAPNLHFAASEGDAVSRARRNDCLCVTRGHQIPEMMDALEAGRDVVAWTAAATNGYSVGAGVDVTFDAECRNDPFTFAQVKGRVSRLDQMRETGTDPLAEIAVDDPFTPKPGKDADASLEATL